MTTRQPRRTAARLLSLFGPEDYYGLTPDEQALGFIARGRVFDLLDRHTVSVHDIREGGIGPGDFLFLTLLARGAPHALVFWGMGICPRGLAVSADRWRFFRLHVTDRQVQKKDRVRLRLTRRLERVPSASHGLTFRPGEPLPRRSTWRACHG